MKGKFVANINLMQIEGVLKEHQPYAALVVSTTGLDNSSFSEHSPTRVVLKEFEYDEALKGYKETITFDKMVKAPQSAIDKAIEGADKYDPFANGGIDRDKYIAGEGVLSVDDFQKEFASVISALKEDGATLIINGDRKFAETYLGKIGCADGINELAENGKVIEQTAMTKEYFQKEGIASKTAKLEDLRNAIAVSPTGSFFKDEALMADFKQMSKDDFLKAYPDVTANKYDLTKRDVENREEKIIGGDNRIKVINDFVTKYGRDEHILANQWQEQQAEAEAAYHEELSEKGKEKYKNADLDDKFNTLVEQKVLKPDDITQGKSEFHKLIDVIKNSGEKKNKGFIIMHAASTGFESGKPPKSTGHPTSFAAIVYKRGEDGKLDMTQKPEGIRILIDVPSKSLQNAIKNINDPKRPYDAFKEAGIDLEQYKTKVNVLSADDAIAKVNTTLKKYPIEDYEIIAIGGTKGSDYSFVQNCMANLGNFTMCEAPYIDFAQAIKDYSYLAHVDNAYPKNALFDELTFNGKTFGIQDVAEARGDGRPLSPAAKCQETAKLIRSMVNQQIELFGTKELIIEKTEPVEKVIEKAAEDAVEKTVGKAVGKPIEKPAPLSTTAVAHTPYENDEEPETSSEQRKAEDGTRGVMFRDTVSEPSEDTKPESDAPTAGYTRPRKIIQTEPDPDEDLLASRRKPSPLFDDIANSGANTRRPNVSGRERPAPYRPSTPAEPSFGARRPVDPRETAERRTMPERAFNKPMADSADTARLLDIIEEQNTVIEEMNKRLMGVVEQTTEKLAAVVERQNELVKFVIQALSDSEVEEERMFRESDQPAKPELTEPQNPHSKLESAVAAIDEVRSSVPSGRAQVHLTNAKQALNSALDEIA